MTVPASAATAAMADQLLSQDRTGALITGTTLYVTMPAAAPR